MNSYAPLIGIAASILFVCLSIWIAIRMIRWAKKGSAGTSLLGLGMGLPAAGINPLPPPQEQIEELTLEIQGKKNSNSSDPDR